MTQADSILEPLNPAQREAVTTTEGPLLVIAGAGSGKTRVITHRIAYLLLTRDVAPWQIFAATFTNKAAEEMKNRVRGLVSDFEGAKLTVATFHSICVTILRRDASRAGLTPQFTIADETDQAALVKDCIRQLNLNGTGIEARGVISWIGAAKEAMYTPEQARESLAGEWGSDYPAIYEMYEQRLAQSNAVDFDDLLLKVVRLYQAEPEVLAQYQDRWRYFLVDEYQDINHVQFEFIRLLAGATGNLCAVGDEDQSIYSWRGADVDNILKFPEIFEGTKTIRLEQNYRSTETILRAANSVISRNRQRLGKTLWSGREGGEPLTSIVGISEREEAALVVETILWMRRLLGVGYKDVAIFYRINALSRLFEDFLRQAEIPYRVIGGIRFYDRAEIKDILAYLRLIANPMDGLSLHRIINKPRRGIGDKSLAKLVGDATRADVSLMEAMRAAAGDSKAKGISGKARAGLADLVAMIDQWRKAAENASPSEMLERVLRDTGFEESLGNPQTLETLARIENIEELKRAVEQFGQENPDAGLGEYLEMVTLSTAVDQMSESDDCVSLMTLHSAKGLEFPAVFMTGLEEGIFPSPRAVTEGRGFEEERRLFYVGVTRAMDRLFLSRADSRSLYGRTQYNPPSTFLLEVPEELVQPIETARQAWTENRHEPPRSRMMGEDARGAAHSESAADLADLGNVANVSVGEPETPPGAFAPGSRVRHASLGEGEVVAVKGEGLERKLSIRFDAGLEIEVLEHYGGLESAEELPF